MTPQEIGSTLFYARKRKGLRLSRMAELVGVVPATLARIEGGTSGTLVNVSAVADVAGYKLVLESKEQMNDEELLKLAREAGWSGCDTAVREKLLTFGRLVIKRKNSRGREEDRMRKMREEAED